MQVPHLDAITAALDRALERLSPVAAEQVSMKDSIGRVLAEPLRADRDSPSMNVSAMDGYAVRLADLLGDLSAERTFQVSAVGCAGHPPPVLPQGKVVQIFTGAPVPDAADCVVRREDTLESPGNVRFVLPTDSLRPGQNIRYRGENIREGAEVLPAGTEVNAGSMAALATFGTGMVSVYRPVQVTILTSGDELVPAGEPAKPWQIRDSNSLTLHCWLGTLPWVDVQCSHSVGDNLQNIQESLVRACQKSDAVILTGGVSAGDTDFVLPAIQALGGTVLFHRLPLRPGKPVLVALLNGKVVVGLPGNPVSAAVTSRLIAEPLLERLAGRSTAGPLRLTVSNPDEKNLNLFWYRLVRRTEIGLQLVDTQGSGDLVSLARSDGFVELPPGCTGAGPWRTWLW